MNDIQVMAILGGLAFNHPSIMSLVSQLSNIWKARQDELTKINNEYIAKAAQATGPLDQAGIVLGLMKEHPDVAPLVIQVLGIMAPHIPELQQAISQTQAQAAQ